MASKYKSLMNYIKKPNNKTKKKAKSKHDKLCKKVQNELLQKDCIDAFVNLEYGITHTTIRGEVDVWEVYDTYEVYYEVKCTNNPKNENKAIDQTLRWSRYMKKHEPQKNYYGVYYTPDLVKIVCKNGVER